MIRELRYNLEMTFKKLSFYFMLIFITGLFSYTLVSLFNNEATRQFLANEKIARIYIMQIYYVISLGAMIMGFFAVLQQVLLLEKESGRIEFLLSNGFSAKRFWISSIIAMWLAGEVFLTAFLSVFIALRKYYFPACPIQDILKVFLDVSMVNMGASSLISSIVLRIRRVAIVRFLTFISVFLISYGGNAIINTTMKKYQEHVSAALLIISIAIGLALFVAGILLGRKIDEETVVLTIPE